MHNGRPFRSGFYSASNVAENTGAYVRTLNSKSYLMMRFDIAGYGAHRSPPFSVLFPFDSPTGTTEHWVCT